MQATAYGCKYVGFWTVCEYKLLHILICGDNIIYFYFCVSVHACV